VAAANGGWLAAHVGEMFEKQPGWRGAASHLGGISSICHRLAGACLSSASLSAVASA